MQHTDSSTIVHHQFVMVYTFGLISLYIHHLHSPRAWGLCCSGGASLHLFLHPALHVTNMEGRPGGIHQRQVSLCTPAHTCTHRQLCHSLTCLQVCSLPGVGAACTGARSEESVCMCQQLSSESAHCRGMLECGRCINSLDSLTRACTHVLNHTVYHPLHNL